MAPRRFLPGTEHSVGLHGYGDRQPSLPYRWEVDEDTVTISVSYGPLDATFKGAFSEEGQRFGGGWRPNPGADETVNVPYDISGRRMR
jgi:hypothetical protein